MRPWTEIAIASAGASNTWASPSRMAFTPVSGAIPGLYSGTVAHSMDALIVVDVQNDFCAGGALAVPDGDAVIEPINLLAREARFVVATRDWHPPNHQLFQEYGGPWPVHRVQGSKGAELCPSLDREKIDAVIDAGQAPDLEGYSGFEGTELERVLRDHGANDVHVAGLASTTA